MAGLFPVHSFTSWLQYNRTKLFYMGSQIRVLVSSARMWDGTMCWIACNWWRRKDTLSFWNKCCVPALRQRLWDVLDGSWATSAPLLEGGVPLKKKTTVRYPEVFKPLSQFGRWVDGSHSSGVHYRGLENWVGWRWTGRGERWGRASKVHPVNATASEDFDNVRLQSETAIRLKG